MKWDLRKSGYPLADTCLAASPEVEELSSKIARYCTTNMPTAWARIAKEKKRAASYYLRLVVPAAELAGWPDRGETQFVGEAAAQLFWCFAWRALDDALDAPTERSNDYSRVLVAHLDAFAATWLISGSKTLKNLRMLEKLQVEASRVSRIERGNGLEINQAWRRCEQCFVVPRLFWSFDRELEERFRQFINVIGLTHDIHDLLSDIKLGINTPPVRWIEQVDADFPFRPQMTHRWFSRARKELDRTVKRCERSIAEIPCKVLRVHLADAREILAELK